MAVKSNHIFIIKLFTALQTYLSIDSYFTI